MAPDARSPIEITPGLKLADLCTLTPEELAARRAVVDRWIAPHARRRVKLEDGVAWEFDASPETQMRLERLAELERGCCGPAELEFSVEAVEDHTLRFAIQGANATALARIIENQGDNPPSGVGRLAKTAGVAGVGAILVCCLLPLGVAAIAGAAVAGPLLKLDDPWVISGVATTFGFGMWQLERRRSRLRAKAVGTSDCGC